MGAAGPRSEGAHAERRAAVPGGFWLESYNCVFAAISKGNMADQRFMDDLMGRTRSLIRTDAKRSTTAASAADQILVRLREQLPATFIEVAAASEVGAIPKVLESCVNASAMVGEINPRHPGFLNDQIQSVKRLMRKSLGWYTRPLRLFHAALIRALQQFATALEKQQEMLSQRALQRDLLETNQRLNDVEQGTCQLYELTTSAIEKSLARTQTRNAEVEVLREEMRGLREELVATRQQLEKSLRERQSPKESYIANDSGESGYVAARSKHVGQERV